MYVGITGQEHTCKIVAGRATIWLTPSGLTIRSEKQQGTFLWPLASLELCQAAETFTHGDFDIQKDRTLGTLLELRGVCVRAEDCAQLVRAAEGRPLHVGVRGMPPEDVAQFISYIGLCSAAKKVPT